MLMKVVVENGVKKLIPLTADAGSGNPCGTIITTLSNTVPSGYLPLGAQFDTTQFPVLYAILGTDTIPTASALGLPTLSAGRYVIKATSGINENQADNVLSALTPVNEVALNNLHSVTSNAVAQKLGNYTKYVEPDIVLHDGNGSYTATENCYATYLCVSSSAITFEVNGADVARHDNASGIYVSVFFGHFKKGTTFSSIGRYVIYSLIS